MKSFIAILVLVISVGCLGGGGSTDAPLVPEETELDFSELTITSAADVKTKREALTELIWGADLPTRLPDEVMLVIDPAWDDVPEIAEIEKIIVNIEDLHSTAYRFRAATPNGSLFIYHDGHGRDFLAGKDTIKFLLSQGYDVLALAMPLAGRNADSRYLTHEALWAAYEHPLRFFIEPPVVGLNWCASQYDEIYAVGLSGGGWTVTVLSALDPRVVCGFPVAGVVPMCLRNPDNTNWGDIEQQDLAIYSVVSYMDMFVMGNRVLPIYNYHDPCCFRGDDMLAYAPRLSEAAAQLGHRFSVVIDYENPEHSISPFALLTIMDYLQST